MSGSSTWTRVASTADVADGQALGLKCQGQNLALYRVGTEWFCTDNICTHAFALLTDGWFEDYLIECPLHAGQFDVRNGKACGGPVDIDLKTFPVRVEGGDVMVALG